MSTQTFSGLPVGNPLSGNEIIPMVQGGINTQTTPSALKAFVGAGGKSVNLKIAVPFSSLTATVIADSVVVETAIGGLTTTLYNINATTNLSVTGVSGMDTGTVPTFGFVALYLIYNPSTNTIATLAQNVSSSSAGSVYGGANMPSGFTYSALVSVWPIQSSKFGVGNQNNSDISIPATLAVSTATSQASYTPIGISGTVPKNAKTISGTISITASSSGNLNAHLSGDYNGTGDFYLSENPSTQSTESFRGLPLITQQTAFYIATASTGLTNFSIYINGYTI